MNFAETRFEYNNESVTSKQPSGVLSERAKPRSTGSSMAAQPYVGSLKFHLQVLKLPKASVEESESLSRREPFYLLDSDWLQ